MTKKKALKRVKKLFDGIKDNGSQILETVILICITRFVLHINTQELFKDYLEQSTLTPDNLFPYLVIKSGKYVVALAVFIIILRQIRCYNNKIIMNQRNVYHNYPYVWYCYCAKILGIRKCNLVLVPIYMQFKLVIQNVFDEFPLDEKDYPVLESEIDCKISEEKNSDCGSEINLILEDTYLIDEKLLPIEKQELSAFKISRNNGESMERHYSPKFVGATVNKVRNLPGGVRVNVYATTNPMNTMYIAKSAFRMADRGNVKHLYVYQQKKTGKRVFESKGHKIY